MAQVLKEEVRNRILEAAEKVFYKKDYRGAKLTEIAKEADIPVALIYTYFKNKEVLFDAVVSSVYINFESAFDEEESLEKGSASERFDEVGENYIHELLKHNIDYIIIGILGVMSFFVLWYTIERIIFYSRVDINSYKSIEELDEALTKNLTTLYIIYSNAPYIGLLGTVAGIMITFYDMGMAGGIDTKSIMIGLSLALKATAFGLLVAIPTLMIYNGFVRKVDVMINRYKAENASK